MNAADCKLLDRLLDDDLPVEERDHVLDRLRTDPDAVAYLAERSMLVADLRRSLKRRQLQATLAAALPETVRRSAANNVIPFWRWQFGPVGWAAAAAMVLLLALGSLVVRQHLKSDSVVLAEIVETESAMPEKSWQAGQFVGFHNVVLTSGRAGLRLTNGVLLSLEGPLRAEFVSGSLLRLRQGRATADVGKNGKGFVIETVNARVVDLGTRFGVVVGASNETDVVVFEGKVEVFDPVTRATQRQPKITLSEGEAIRVDDSRKRQRMRMVALRADARTLQGGQVSDVVADVTDNIVAVDSQRFYGLVRAGMSEGARIYTTGHSRTWQALPDEIFPQELIGADVVCTFYPARREKDLEITISVTRPCVLYVFPDARQPVPEWLQRDFTDTGLRLRSGPWLSRGVELETLPPGEEGKTYVPYNVWKKTISQPGSVVLGTPCAPGNDDRQAMYGIAVKALP